MNQKTLFSSVSALALILQICASLPASAMGPQDKDARGTVPAALKPVVPSKDNVTPPPPVAVSTPTPTPAPASTAAAGDTTVAVCPSQQLPEPYPQLSAYRIQPYLSTLLHSIASGTFPLQGGPGTIVRDYIGDQIEFSAPLPADVQAAIQMQWVSDGGNRHIKRKMYSSQSVLKINSIEWTVKYDVARICGATIPTLSTLPTNPILTGYYEGGVNPTGSFCALYVTAERTQPAAGVQEGDGRHLVLSLPGLPAKSFGYAPNSKTTFIEGSLSALAGIQIGLADRYAMSGPFVLRRGKWNERALLIADTTQNVDTLIPQTK